MNALRPELILSDGDLAVRSAPASPGDEELLDSYSRTIAAVVNRVAPTVVNIRVLNGERGRVEVLDSSLPATDSSDKQPRGSRCARA
jgi:hypothetical protein